MEAKTFLKTTYTYAVVGASANAAKFGNIVYFDLKNGGYRVIPVNPKLTRLGDDHAVASIKEILPPPDVIVSVVPPDVGLKILEEGAAHGTKKFWFQPGAESPEIRKKAEALGVEVIADGSCIMVGRRVHNGHS